MPIPNDAQRAAMRCESAVSMFAAELRSQLDSSDVLAENGGLYAVVKLKIVDSSDQALDALEAGDGQPMKEAVAKLVTKVRSITEPRRGAPLRPSE